MHQAPDLKGSNEAKLLAILKKNTTNYLKKNQIVRYEIYQ